MAKLQWKYDHPPLPTTYETTLKELIERSYVTLETVQTVVTEIETISKDRPLTYMSSNIDDAGSLTPAHLVYGCGMGSFPHNSALVIDDLTSSKAEMHHRTCVLACIIDSCWRSGGVPPEVGTPPAGNRRWRRCTGPRGDDGVYPEPY